MKLTVALSVLAFAWCCTEAGQAEPIKLKGPEIVKLLAGRTIYGSSADDPSAQAFAADGTTAFKSGSDEKHGRWRIMGDKYCSAWDANAQPACSEVFVEPPTVTFVGQGGEKHIWLLAKP